MELSPVPPLRDNARMNESVFSDDFSCPEFRLNPESLICLHFYSTSNKTKNYNEKVFLRNNIYKIFISVAKAMRSSREKVYTHPHTPTPLSKINKRFDQQHIIKSPSSETVLHMLTIQARKMLRTTVLMWSRIPFGEIL